MKQQIIETNQQVKLQFFDIMETLTKEVRSLRATPKQMFIQKITKKITYP